MIGAHITDALWPMRAKWSCSIIFRWARPKASAIWFRIAGEMVRGDILRVNELFDGLEAVDGVFAAAGFLTLPLTQIRISASRSTSRA